MRGREGPAHQSGKKGQMPRPHPTEEVVDEQPLRGPSHHQDGRVAVDGDAADVAAVRAAAAERHADLVPKREGPGVPGPDLRRVASGARPSCLQPVEPTQFRP